MFIFCWLSVTRVWEHASTARIPARTTDIPFSPDGGPAAAPWKYYTLHNVFKQLWWAQSLGSAVIWMSQQPKWTIRGRFRENVKIFEGNTAERLVSMSHFNRSGVWLYDLTFMNGKANKNSQIKFSFCTGSVCEFVSLQNSYLGLIWVA